MWPAKKFSQFLKKTRQITEWSCWKTLFRSHVTCQGFFFFQSFLMITILVYENIHCTSLISFLSPCRNQVRKTSVQKTVHGWSKIYLWSRKVCIQGRKVKEFQPHSDPSDYGLEETMYKTQKYGQKINLLRFTLWPTFT